MGAGAYPFRTGISAFRLASFEIMSKHMVQSALIGHKLTRSHLLNLDFGIILIFYNDS